NLEKKDGLIAELSSLKSELLIKNVELLHELRTANASLIKARGRLDARTAIDFCENNKMAALGVNVNRNSRKGTWEKVFNLPDFYESQEIANKALSLKY
ncbi:unnamed protein product, partial [Auanema sp. JU1783]